MTESEPDPIECPACGSERTRVYWPSEDEVVVDCGECFETTTSLFGDITVVSDE